MSDEVPIDPAQGDDAPRCSARGCRAAATVDLVWRNPGLHAAARRKHWLACAQHEDHLADFLGRRGFLLGRGPLVQDARDPATEAGPSEPATEAGPREPDGTVRES